MSCKGLYLCQSVLSGGCRFNEIFFSFFFGLEHHYNGRRTAHRLNCFASLGNWRKKDRFFEIIIIAPSRFLFVSFFRGITQFSDSALKNFGSFLCFFFFLSWWISFLDCTLSCLFLLAPSLPHPRPECLMMSDLLF